MALIYRGLLAVRANETCAAFREFRLGLYVPRIKNPGYVHHLGMNESFLKIRTAKYPVRHLRRSVALFREACYTYLLVQMTANSRIERNYYFLSVANIPMEAI